FVRYPVYIAQRTTASRASGETHLPPFRYRDTVPRDTPAAEATSLMVGRLRGTSKISELPALSLLCTIPAWHGLRNLQVARFLTIEAVHVHSRGTPATQTVGAATGPTSPSGSSERCTGPSGQRAGIPIPSQQRDGARCRTTSTRPPTMKTPSRSKSGTFPGPPPVPSPTAVTTTPSSGHATSGKRTWR